MEDRKGEDRRIWEVLKLDRIAMNWVFLVIPILAGVIGGALPVLLEGLAIAERIPEWLAWGTLCTLGGTIVSLQIGIRRWIVADRLLLERKINKAFGTHEHTLDFVGNFVKLKRSRDHEPFGLLAEDVLTKAERDLRRMLHDRKFTLQVVTPSEEYVRRWGSLMNQLMEAGSTFDTVTNMEIWSRTYMGGPRSNYSQKNANPDGTIQIRRVFVVPSDEMLQDTSMRHRLKDVLEHYNKKMNGKEHIQTKICRSRSREEYHQHFNPGGESDNFGIWKLSNDLVVCLAVRYRPGPPLSGYEITDITFRIDEGFVAEREPLFQEKFEDGEFVGNYLDWLRSQDAPATRSQRTGQVTAFPGHSTDPLKDGV